MYQDMAEKFQDILRTEKLLNHLLQLDTIPLHIV